jgi:hypothetical protein
MKINPQSFFNFCANHASLLRGLAERGGEISEAEARRLIRANPSAVEEMAETAWRRLRELQILVPSENMGTEEKRRADRGRRSPNASRGRWPPGGSSELLQWQWGKTLGL